jgi:hypothetical protein
LLEGPWTQVRDEVEAQLLPILGGAETYVLCRSTARREKELAIRRRFSTRLEDPQPTPDQQQLLDQLEITIPTYLEWNAECSADLTMS